MLQSHYILWQQTGYWPHYRKELSTLASFFFSSLSKHTNIKYLTALGGTNDMEVHPQKKGSWPRCTVLWSGQASITRGDFSRCTSTGLWFSIPQRQVRWRRLFLLLLLFQYLIWFILQGTTRNMASPVLENLVIKFFYAGPSALATLFPEVFAREVPRTIVCLAAIAVRLNFPLSNCSHNSLQLRAAIDEYLISGTCQDRQFEYATYSKVFTQFMGMQSKIDANAKHATMMHALRVSWANAGRWAFLSLHFIYLICCAVHCVTTTMRWSWMRMISTLFLIRLHWFACCRIFCGISLLVLHSCAACVV